MNNVTVIIGKKRRQYASMREALGGLRWYFLWDALERDLLFFFGLD